MGNETAGRRQFCQMPRQQEPSGSSIATNCAHLSAYSAFGPLECLPATLQRQPEINFSIWSWLFTVMRGNTVCNGHLLSTCHPYPTSQPFVYTHIMYLSEDKSDLANFIILMFLGKPANLLSLSLFLQLLIIRGGKEEGGEKKVSGGKGGKEEGGHGDKKRGN